MPQPHHSFLQTLIAHQDPRLSLFDPGIEVIGCRLWGHPTEAASSTMEFDPSSISKTIAEVAPRFIFSSHSLGLARFDNDLLWVGPLALAVWPIPMRRADVTLSDLTYRSPDQD